MNLNRYIIEDERIKVLANILFVISGVMLTFIMSLNYALYITYNGYIYSGDYKVQLPYAFIAAGIMLFTYIYLCKKRNFVLETIGAASTSSFYFSFFMSICIFLQLVQDTEKNLSHIFQAFHFPVEILSSSNSIHTVVALVCVLTVFSVLVFTNYVVNLILLWLFKFIKKSNEYDKIFFCVALFACLSIICYFHSKTRGIWDSLDLVYQTDATFVYHNYYPVFSFSLDFDYDIGVGGIRHPLATMITYPIYVIVSVIANLFFWIPNVQAILYAVVQSILMILSVIMIRRIINSNWIYLLFILSFPFIFYSYFIEKYPIAVFYIVLYVYSTVCEKDENVQRYSLIAAGGMTITSAFLGLLYGKEKQIKKRLLEYNSAVMLFLITLIGTGRIHYILDFYRLLHQNSVMFYEGVITELGFDVKDRIFGYTNLFASSLIPLEYRATDLNFQWITLIDKVNYFGLVVLLVVAYASGRYIKNKKVFPFVFWFLYSIFQFLIVGFGTNCEILFTLYFSWSFIPLFILGLNNLIRNIKIRNLIYIGLLFVMFYKNYIHCKDLLAYLMYKAPI